MWLYHRGAQRIVGLVPESELWFDPTRQVPLFQHCWKSERPARSRSVRLGLLGSDNVLEMVEVPCAWS